MRFCTLFSGSSGNCTYIEQSGKGILIDAGCSAKKITNGLTSLGSDISNVLGIFVTHEHTDHINALRVLSSKYKKPIIGTKGTLDGILSTFPEIDDSLFMPIEPGDSAELFDFRVTSFKTPHDSACSVGYIVDCGNKKAGVATDMGHISQSFLKAAKSCDCLLLESNYDEAMLKNGSYPYFLKERIQGQNGHLSNNQCGYAITELVKRGVTKIMLGHLSEQNNTCEKVQESVCRVLTDSGMGQGDVSLCIAPRHERSNIFEY